MIARIINIATARAKAIGGAETYGSAQAKFLRACGLMATNPTVWWRYWFPIRWMAYPWHSVNRWWTKE